MSIIKSVLLFGLAFLHKFDAFFVQSSKLEAKVLKKFCLSMTAPAQKLGQTVIGITVPPVIQDPDTASVFKRPPVGSGSDDRVTKTKNEDTEKWPILSKIDKSFQQKTLLMGLEGSSWGIQEKYDRVLLASSLENLLPSSFSNEVITTSRLNAAGLLKDWDF
jgi:hypothetical protein